MHQNKKLLFFISTSLLIIVISISFIYVIKFKGITYSNLKNNHNKTSLNYNEEISARQAEEQNNLERLIDPSNLHDNNKKNSYVQEPVLTQGMPYYNNLIGNDSINVLIIGENKIEGLYDTISIISIDSKNKKVKIIMIPRDTYIEYNKKILQYLEKENLLNVPGMFKINTAHNIGKIIKYNGKFKSYESISFLVDIIKEKFNVEVDEYIKADTDTFAQIVDIFGGVKIDVPYLMNYNDPVQNLYIYIEKGLQTLNGKQAEGFVRFRQGYNENGKLISYGDVERKENQIVFLKAFIEQHGTISNIDKIPKFLKTLGKKVQYSMGAGDVLFRYMKIVKDIVENNYEIEGVTLSGQLKWINGSQYMILDGK